MQKLLSNYGVTVISAPKSSGVRWLACRALSVLSLISLPFNQVVDLDDAYRARIRAQQIKTYFYGEPALPAPLAGLPGRISALETGLHPYSFTIPWDELEIYRIGEGAIA